MKHTQGPWEFKNGSDIFGPLGGDSGDGVKADHNDGWMVAEVGCYSAFVDGEFVQMGREVREANAKLIAAAPELLEALELLIKWFDAEDNPEVLIFMTELKWLEKRNPQLKQQSPRPNHEQVYQHQSRPSIRTYSAHSRSRNGKQND